MSKRCSICRHPALAEIEAAIAQGESLRRIGERFGVSKTTLIRHREHAHIEVDRRTDSTRTTYPPGGAALLDELKHAKLEDVADLKRYLEALNSVILEVLRESFLAGRAGTALHAARELRQSLELLAELLNALNRSHSSTVQVALVESPEWIKVRGAIAQALQPYPEARRALAAALEALRA